MKVLVAVDGSDGSFAAVDQIGRVVSADRDEVGLYCSPPDMPAGAGNASGARQGVAEAIFDAARKRLPEALQARVHTITGTQDARHGILTAADQCSADLVAVGARGLNSLKRLLLGSVSRAIVHRSTRPVWLARENPSVANRGMNVLLTCETPALCRPAAELLTRFTWPPGTSFRTLSVVRSILAGRMPDWLEQQPRSPEVEAMVKAWASEHDDDLRVSRTQLEQFVRSLPAPLEMCEALIAEGEPAREILAAIPCHDIDLVTLTGQAKRSVTSYILGSTSEAVLNHAGCSVLVVPQRAN